VSGSGHYFTAGLALGAVFATACQALPSNADLATRQTATGTSEASMTNQHLAINQRFRSLDDYLEYLRKRQAPVDGPWYREIRPGVYELQTGNFRPLGAQAPKRVFTREELEKKFGFSR
jgi:hypothetical protein